MLIIHFLFSLHSTLILFYCFSSFIKLFSTYQKSLNTTFLKLQFCTNTPAYCKLQFCTNTFGRNCKFAPKLLLLYKHDPCNSVKNIHSNLTSTNTILFVSSPDIDMKKKLKKKNSPILYTTMVYINLKHPLDFHNS